MPLRRLAPLLLALAACSRSFGTPPPPPAAPGGPTLASVEPGEAFAGQVVLLRGTGFATGAGAAQADLVRFGSTIAPVLGDGQGGPPAPDAVAVQVPDLGPSRDEQVTVSITVEGRTAQAPAPFRYRGPGHPAGFSLTPGADLSPTPTHVSAFEGVQLVSLLRNNVYALLYPAQAFVATTPAATGNLPFSTALTVTPAGLGLWGAELVPSLQGVSVVFREGPLLPDVPFGLEQKGGMPLVGANLDPFVALRPVSGGAVLLHGVGVPVPTLPAAVSTWELPGLGPAGSAVQPGVPDDDGGLVAGVAPLVDLLAAVYLDANGRLGLARTATFPVLQAAPALLDAGPPLLLANDGGFAPAQASVGLSPDGQLAYVALSSGAASEVLELVLTDGGQRWVVPPSLVPADGVISAQGTLATWSQQRAEVLLRQADGTPLRAVALPGLPLDVERDLTPPHHLFAAVASPPALVEIDPTSGDVVSTRSLSNGLSQATLSPAGDALAVGATALPTLAVLDSTTLAEQAPGFLHSAQPGEAEGHSPGPLAFLEVDGGGGLCGVVQGAFGFGVDAVRCGASTDLLGGGACQLYPGPLGQSDGGSLLALEATLAALPGGGLRVFGPLSAWDCQPDASGCPSACGAPVPLGSVRQGWETLEPVPGGGAVMLGYTATGRELLLWSPDGTTQPLCQGSACGVLEPSFSGLAVSGQGRWVGVLGHATQVYDLTGPDAPRLAAVITFFSDVPRALAFSPDGQRLYAGTTLGHLDEYDLAPAMAAPTGTPARLEPTRSLFTGFPISRVLAQPDGSRLLLFDQGSDRIFVVR